LHGRGKKTCSGNEEVPNERGIFSSDDANFRSNTLCIARKLNDKRRKKRRSGGVSAVAEQVGTQKNASRTKVREAIARGSTLIYHSRKAVDVGQTEGI